MFDAFAHAPLVSQIGEYEPPEYPIGEDDPLTDQYAYDVIATTPHGIGPCKPGCPCPETCQWCDAQAGWDHEHDCSYAAWQDAIAEDGERQIWWLVNRG